VTEVVVERRPGDTWRGVLTREELEAVVKPVLDRCEPLRAGHCATPVWRRSSFPA